MPNERIRNWATVVLVVLACAYIGRGFYGLVISDRAVTDLHLRYLDQRYLYGGQNPYDVLWASRALRAGEPLPSISRDNHVRPDLGPLETGGMPPWSFTMLAALVLPVWPLARSWYALLHVGCLTFIAYWVWRETREFGPSFARFMCASTLAVSSICTTLWLGNLGIFVVATLAAALMLDQRRPDQSAFWLAVAAIKPTISGPFLLPLLVYRRWRSIVVAGAVLVACSLATWPMSKTNPVEMLQQMQNSASEFLHTGYGLINVVLWLGLPVRVATPVLAVTVSLASLALMIALRQRSLLQHFAIAAVAGRIWTYHTLYDNLMLTFLLVALGIAAMRRASPALWVAFGAVGLSLWLPGKATDYLAFKIFQHLAWFSGLGMLLALDRETVRKPGELELPETSALGPALQPVRAEVVPQQIRASIE